MKEKYQDILFLAVVALAVLYRSFDIMFVGDNLIHIEQARQNIFDLTFQYFRPLSILTLIIDNAVWGYNHIGYHVTNFMVHLLNVALVYILAVKFVNERFFAYVAAILFLLHPIHSSSIFWISGRGDMICTAFFLLALLSFVNFVKDNTAKNLIYTLTFFVLSLLSKEMAITFPIIAALYFYFFAPDSANKSLKKAFSATWLLWVIAILFVVFRLLTAGATAFSGDVHTNFNLMQIVKNLAAFFGLLVVPGGHIEIYNLLRANPTAFAVLSILAILILIVSFKWLKKHAALFFFALFVLITLLPVLRLAMRWYLYLPSVGFCLAVGFVLWRISQSSEMLKKGALILTTVIALTYTLFLVQEQHRWIKSGDIAKSVSEEIAARIILDGPGQCLILNVPGEFEETPVLIHGLESIVNFKLNSVFQYTNYAEIFTASYVSMRGAIEDAYPELEIINDTSFSLSLESSQSFFVFPHEIEFVNRSMSVSPGYTMEELPFAIVVDDINEFKQANLISIQIIDTSSTVYYVSPNGVNNVFNVIWNPAEPFK